MPGHWETIRKEWEAGRTERYNNAEIRILKSRKKVVEAQQDLSEATARVRGKVQLAVLRTETEVLEAQAGLLDVQARILSKQNEIRQLMRGETPLAALPPAPAPKAIAPYQDDQEVEGLAQRIAHAVGSKPKWQRDEAWEEVRSGLRRDLEPYAAEEVERRAQQILSLLGK